MPGQVEKTSSPAGTIENGACRVAALAKTDFVSAVPAGLICNTVRPRRSNAGLFSKCPCGTPCFPTAQDCDAPFPPQKFSNNFLRNFVLGVETDCSLKWMNIVHPSSQSNVREPGVNPGRLRHCNGYNFPGPLPRSAAAGRREGGLRPKSGYRFGCARRAPTFLGATSPSKRRMRPACRTVSGRIRWMPSFSVLPGSEGVFVFRPRRRPRPRSAKRFSRTRTRTRTRTIDFPALVSQPKTRSPKAFGETD